MDAKNSPLRLLIHGATGRMGQALLRLAGDEAGMQVVAAVARRPPTQSLLGSVPFFPSEALAEVPEFDVLVDFSLPEAFDAALALALARGRALVSGTTGLAATAMQALDAAGREIPVLWASNFSLGVALLHQLVAEAARAVPGWDCDIIEMHHARKLDAPSGTALTLGKAVEAAGGALPHYAAIRAGDIVGEHCVQFAGFGERIELVHRAVNRDIFARGALHAARWLATRPAGRHAIADILRP